MALKNKGNIVKTMEKDRIWQWHWNSFKDPTL